MKSTYKLGAMALAAMLVLSVFAPTVMAATAAGNTAGNTAGNVSVTTGAAENVTGNSAELNGEVSGLNESDSANVSFTYWVEGDSANNTTVDAGTLDSNGTFSETLFELENDTTYVYVAHAEVNGTTVSGGEETFSTGTEADIFGQRVSAFVHDLLSDEDREGGIGQAVSEFVTSNNPGADKRPDHAGPPEDRGPKDKADKEPGPPDHAGGPDDANTSDEEEEDDDDDVEAEEEEEPGNGNGNGKK